MFFIAKLEGELKTIQIRQEEQFVAQEKEIQLAQDKIVVIAYDVDEIRRRLEDKKKIIIKD